MAELPMYESLESKKPFFKNRDKGSFKINTKKELDKWVEEIEDEIKKSKSATTFIYRGVAEAKYKIFTSAQRFWITNNMKQWAEKSYLAFTNDLIKAAKDNKLIDTVFNLYNFKDSERDLPILSLLQHYGAPTPLLDWTYSLKVALFFGTEGIKKEGTSCKHKIDEYFSIYRINKRDYLGEFLHVKDFQYKYDTSIPPFQKLMEFGEEPNDESSNGVYYISDFEVNGESIDKDKGFPKLIIRTKKPLTSVYNQNIIPQKGLFILNPYSDKSLEEIFNPNPDGPSLPLHPFECFNIHKDLLEYLRRKIDVQDEINTKFIYPELKTETEEIMEKTIDGLITDN